MFTISLSLLIGPLYDLDYLIELIYEFPERLSDTGFYYYSVFSTMI